jgi:hypothetical protein
MTVATALSATVGALAVRPGAGLGQSLVGTRQNWASRLARGQTANALPDLMASLFNLCSHAHRLCCQWALDAAAGLSVAEPACDSLVPLHDASRLQLETAREHIRRIGLDWPRMLAPQPDAVGTSQATDALLRCPLLQATPSWPAALAWLESDLLHLSARDWLAQWSLRGADWLQEWSCAGQGWLPTLVQQARPADSPLALDMSAALQPHASVQSLQVLADALACHPGLSMRPQWQGACAHTGSWTRLRAAPAVGPLTPWALLGSRLAELIRLCLPDAPGQGGQWLAGGRMACGPQQGLAWVEMARGLLVYRVALVADPAIDPARVAACDVLAPTEWNFHPLGEVARRLSAIDPAQPLQAIQHQTRLLMAAFDPCVPFSMLEAPHA